MSIHNIDRSQPQMSLEDTTTDHKHPWQALYNKPQIPIAQTIVDRKFPRCRPQQNRKFRSIYISKSQISVVWTTVNLECTWYKPNWTKDLHSADCIKTQMSMSRWRVNRWLDSINHNKSQIPIVQTIVNHEYSRHGSHLSRISMVQNIANLKCP